MRNGRVLAVAVMATLALVGCGKSSDSSDNPVAGGPGTTTAAHDHDTGGSCSPSGTTLSISAKDVKFDKSCLAAPADQAFTINFDNKDSVPHSVAILVSHTAPDALFTGDVVTGPKTTAYKVNALKAGTYHFHCMVHPDLMNGDFIVK
jgi:plastocyanin